MKQKQSKQNEGNVNTFVLSALQAVQNNNQRLEIENGVARKSMGISIP